MKKETFQKQNRFLIAVLMLLTTLTVHAEDGDCWEAEGVISGIGSVLHCTFSVVSEEDATVKFVKTPGRSNTFTDKTAAYITMLDEVEHDGKTYTVVEIGDSAFCHLPYLEEVRHMSAGVKRIGMYAFLDCPQLRAVNLPEGLEIIFIGAFRDCTSLATTITDGVTDDAFYVPSSVKHIVLQAFYNCSKVDVKLNEGLLSIGWFAFAHCKALTEVTIPSTVLEVRSTSFTLCDNLQNIFVHPDNQRYYDINGVLYGCLEGGYDNMRCLMEFPGGRTGRYDIDDRTDIIREYAFGGSQLSEVFIPMTVGGIDANAFYNCKNLQSVYVEWTGYIPPIPDKAFDNIAAQNTLLYIPDEATGMTADDILNLYLDNNTNRFFAGVESYTPKALSGLRIAGYGIPRTKTFGIEKGVTAGTVNYEIANRKLVLTDATIDATGNDAYGIENIAVDGLTIELNGTNTIRTFGAGMSLTDDNTIVGPGSLKIESEQERGIFISRGRLDIVDATLDIISRGGDISGEMEAYVNITNSSLTLRPTWSLGVATVNNLTQMNLYDSHFDQPLLAEFWPWLGCVVDRHGEPSEGYITIRPSNGYDLFVGTLVTEANKDDITFSGLSRGTASYDPERKLLTLDNVRMDRDPGLIYNRVPGLIVKLVGANSLVSYEDGITLYSDATFTGDGSLQVTSDGSVGILIDEDYTKLTISNTTMNIYGAQGSVYGREGGEERSVVVNNSNVVMHADPMVDVTKYLSDFELNNCHFFDMNHYFDGSYGGICNYDDSGRLENYYPVEIVADGQPTAISQYPSSPNTHHPSAGGDLQSPTVYDLQGRRINGTPSRGIYIIGTRKVVLK